MNSRYPELMLTWLIGIEFLLAAGPFDARATTNLSQPAIPVSPSAVVGEALERPDASHSHFSANLAAFQTSNDPTNPTPVCEPKLPEPCRQEKNETSLARTIVVPGWIFSEWLAVMIAIVGALALLVTHIRQARKRRSRHEMRLAVRTGERNRIARELHDTLLQGFSSLQIRLHMVRNVIEAEPANAVHILDGALQYGEIALEDAQSAIQELRSFSGAGSNLSTALESLGADLSRNGCAVLGPRFAISVAGLPTSFDSLVQDDIYCIAREAVRNAFQHAGARKIDVSLDYGEARFTLQVRDDGMGIPASVTSKGTRPGHWGLLGMRERAESFGGNLNVSSQSVSGTTVVLTVPSKLYPQPWLRRQPLSRLVRLFDAKRRTVQL